MYFCGMAKRNEIRIVDVSDKTFNAVKKRAKSEKRTLGKQALVHIENDLKKSK